MIPCDSLLPSLPLCDALFRCTSAIYAHRQEIGTANMRSPKDSVSSVENDTEFEILAARCRQLSKLLEIAGSDGRGRFDLNTNYISTLTFHDDVHFVLNLISVVVKPAHLGQPIDLFHNLRESESLKQRAKTDRSLPIRSSVVPKIAASKSLLPEDRVRYTQLAISLAARRWILKCRRGACSVVSCCHSRIVGDREPRSQRSVSSPDNVRRGAVAEP